MDGTTGRTGGLHHESHGEGEPVLLLHGAGEDTTLLRPLAAALAAEGYRAVVYDRRGTGGSPRQPGETTVAQHVADAADLLTAVVGTPSLVLGVSSGGVLALELAATHPDLVTEVVAWEPAAVAALDDGETLHAMLMAAPDAHLAAHPGDWTGAYDLMLTAISDGQADLDDPTVAAMRRNAEAAIRDDARVITRHRLDGEALAGAPAVLATSERPGDLHEGVVTRLAETTGLPVWRVTGADDHEVYLGRPEILAGALRARRSTGRQRTVWQ